MSQKYLIKEFEDLGRKAGDVMSLMQHMADRIHAHIPRYNWVGFYLLDAADSSLALGPHKGSFTPNAKLSVNQGLCGTAISTGRTIAADNVAEDTRYLAASDMVKSQISVPVMASGKPAAVFNVESYFLATFKPATERDFVEACARIVGTCADRVGITALAPA